MTYLDLRVFSTFHTCSLTPLESNMTAVAWRAKKKLEQWRWSPPNFFSTHKKLRSFMKFPPIYIGSRLYMHAASKRASWCHAGSRQRVQRYAWSMGKCSSTWPPLHCYTALHSAHTCMATEPYHAYICRLDYLCNNKCDDTYLGVYTNIWWYTSSCVCVVIKLKAVVSTWKSYLTLSYPNQPGLQVVSVAYPIVSSPGP
jgi:hypothetical protein